MSQSMLKRAYEWVEKTAPSADDLLASHNNIVKQIKRGAINAEDAEQTLDYLGELYVEAEGDPFNLRSVDEDELHCPEPVQFLGAAERSVVSDSALINYDGQVGVTALQGEEKAAMFALLRQKVGVHHVTAR